MSLNNYKKKFKNVQNEFKTEYAGLDELWDNEKYLVNYNKFIISQLSQNFDHREQILEFGAGLGTLTLILKKNNFKNIDCVEIDKRSIEVLRSRKLRCFEKIEDIKLKYDSIFTSNVLEHIENDTDVLLELTKIIKKDGILSIYVPAFNILYSELDQKMGHFRRYELNDLKMKLSEMNFTILKSHYADSVGFFASLAIKFLGFKRTLNLGNKKSLVFYDKFIFPISKALDKLGLKYFFGKNIIIIARYNR